MMLVQILDGYDGGSHLGWVIMVVVCGWVVKPANASVW